MSSLRGIIATRTHDKMSQALSLGECKVLTPTDPQSMSRSRLYKSISILGRTDMYFIESQPR